MAHPDLSMADTLRCASTEQAKSISQSDDRPSVRRSEKKAPNHMLPIDVTRAERRQRHARATVLFALTIAFFGAMQGVLFGIVLGDERGLVAASTGLVTIVTLSLLVLVLMRPAMATGVVTVTLCIYLVLQLNFGAIASYGTSQDIVRLLPNIIWFFPLVVFHHFTNFGFYKRSIGLVVGLSPLPTAAYVLTHLNQPIAIKDVEAMVTFMVSFFAFVIFVGFYGRHRDEEVQHAAMLEEAERSAEAMRVSEERFRLLSAATNDLIWDADLKSGTIWWNDTLLDVYGYDPQALRTNMTAWEIWVHPDDHDRVVESLRAVMDGGGTNWISEYRFMRADGRTAEVVDRGLIIRGNAGEPVRMIGSTTDVTELRALERKLRHSQKMEAVGQLTGGIAHDFNNLLTIIVGNAESLEDIHSSNPRARRLAQTTMQAAERGAVLTSRLLSFARRQPLAPKHLDPGKLLSGLEDLIRRTITEDIAIEIKVAPGVWPIDVDQSQLENAILNLVINGRDAMPDGGTLTVEASNVTLDADDPRRNEGMSGHRFVRIAVSDTGCGMTSDVVDRAFEPFFTTKEMGKGSGLGLSMVWGFVQQSNGNAQIQSILGQGTTVTLCFCATSALPAQAAPRTPVVGLVGGTERILVVEDDALVRKNAVAQLSGLGYSITEAASADEALDVMDSGWMFDLLFTDVVMPGSMNGRQLADAAVLRRPEIKVLFTSGYTRDAMTHAGRLDPDVSLLGKPYRRAELAEKIRRALDS